MSSKKSRFALCALFLGVAVVVTWNADPSFGFGPDQVAYNLTAEELLAAWEEERPLKSEFGSAYRQSFSLFHAAGQRLLGSATASYLTILFLSTLAYVAAMYLLMAHVLEHRGIAALTAVLSIVQRYTLGTSFWGMGEFQSILPRVVVLAVFPIAWLIVERHISSRRVLEAFLLVALSFALHLSAAYFYCILLMTVALHIFRSRSWSSLPTLAIATALLPFALKGVPNVGWSHMMEKAAPVAVPLVLIGLALVLSASRWRRRRWLEAATVVWLGLSFTWLLGGASLRSMIGMSADSLAAELAEKPSAPAPDPPSEAAPQVSDQPARPAVEPQEVAELQPAEEPPPPQPVRPDPRADKPATPEATRTAVAQDDPAIEGVAAENRALYARFGWTLFPISLATLGFALFNGALVGAVALYEFVRRCRHGATQREWLVGSFGVSVLVLSLGMTAGIQLYSRLTGRPDVILELFRAFKFIYLPLYIYLGLFLERVWVRSRGSVSLGRQLALGLLIVALLLPPRQALASMPDRVKLMVRSAAKELGALHEGDPSQEKYLNNLLATDREREEARAQQRHFVELCTWVRRSTPADALFLTTRYDFIYYTGRDIMISYAQGAGSARSMAAKSGYQAWHNAYQDISGALASRSTERIMEVAREYEADYVLTTAEQPPLPAPVAHSNPSFTLYRVTP